MHHVIARAGFEHRQHVGRQHRLEAMRAERPSRDGKGPIDRSNAKP